MSWIFRKVPDLHPTCAVCVTNPQGTPRPKGEPTSGDAVLHSLEVRWADGILTLKFRTLLVGPAAGQQQGEEMPSP
jgi:hypothetical protein